MVSVAELKKKNQIVMQQLERISQGQVPEEKAHEYLEKIESAYSNLSQTYGTQLKKMSQNNRTIPATMQMLERKIQEFSQKDNKVAKAAVKKFQSQYDALQKVSDMQNQFRTIYRDVNGMLGQIRKLKKKY